MQVPFITNTISVNCWHFQVVVMQFDPRSCKRRGIPTARKHQSRAPSLAALILRQLWLLWFCHVHQPPAPLIRSWASTPGSSDSAMVVASGSDLVMGINSGCSDSATGAPSAPVKEQQQALDLDLDIGIGSGWDLINDLDLDRSLNMGNGLGHGLRHRGLFNSNIGLDLDMGVYLNTLELWLGLRLDIHLMSVGYSIMLVMLLGECVHKSTQDTFADEVKVDTGHFKWRTKRNQIIEQNKHEQHKLTLKPTETRHDFEVQNIKVRVRG